VVLYTRNERIFTNARFVVETLGECKPGECMVCIADAATYGYARVMCDVARELGLSAMIIDIDCYGGDERYMKLPVMEPLRQAILHADLVFMLTDQMLTDFGMFLGNPDECDTALLGHSRRFTFEETGMEAWQLDPQRILYDRARTLRLYKKLQSARTLTITTARGTDLTCDVTRADAMYPVMAIIPFYAEVALIPGLGSVNGTVIADGASECAYGQRGEPIRPAQAGNMELWKKPMGLHFRDSLLIGWDGDAVQAARLDKLMEDVDPAPRLCDEIGLVTATSVENDRWGWRIDGSHQTRCVHVAIGNNYRRGEVIHAPEHVDFDVHEPTITLDGTVICENGVFTDAV